MQPDGAIEAFEGEHRWLSNFWQVSVQYDGQIYPSVEHAYQASKTDPAWRAPFQGGRPGQAKAHGRRVPMRSGWHDEKLDIMRDLIEQKFAPGSELAAKLLATQDVEIIEGNTWGDTFWGVCGGQGENNLGKLIMAQRQRLREAEQASPVQKRANGAPPRFRF